MIGTWIRWALGGAMIPALLVAAPRSTYEPFRFVTIEARDYVFRAPTVVPPGLTAFRLVNHGTVLHEVQIFRLAPSVTAAAARAYLQQDGDVPDSAADSSGSVLITAPGTTAHEQVLIDLQRGEVYALLCAFRDAPDKPRHGKLGMFGTIEVR